MTSTSPGPEIDLVVEMPDGRIAGIEVKAAASVTKDDFRHLALIRDKVDEARGTFVRGVVLYTGRHALSFGDRLLCAPLAALWLPLSGDG